MPIRTMIIDDEPIARRGVRRLLSGEPDIEIVGECSDGLEALESIPEKFPDVIFLDIQMPELGGFEVLEALEKRPVVIFVTAYDEFAMKAFSVHALDYLLKPLKPELLHLAVEKARAIIQYRQKQAFDKKLDGLLSFVASSKNYRERFVVKSTKRIVLVHANDVDWLEAYGDYVRLYVGEKKFLLRNKFKEIEQSLDPKKFARIHRSTIVQINRIVGLEPMTNGDYIVILSSGIKRSLSRSYSRGVLAQLEGKHLPL
ncbi:MAG: response regulator transcription factor [Bacteroidetes bacterium]|nr:MAG: response regulator transcription factor [Bacteroidota bacterium]